MLDFMPMKPVSASDYYEVRKMGSISSAALASLTDLYLPIIGPLSLSSYQCLIADPTIGKKHSLASHGDILAKLRMTSGQFEAALKPLEAVGLVKTFAKASEDGTYFVYCVYPPLPPEEFLSDILFHGILVNYIGEPAVKELEKKYPMGVEPEDMEECSESFVDFFHPDFSSALFRGDVQQKKRGVNTGFDRNEFKSRLREFGIAVHNLGEDDLERIGKLGALYDLSSSTLAEIAYDCYRDGRLDTKAFELRCRDSLEFSHLRKQGEDRKSRVSGDSKKADLVRMMDNMAPAQYLAYLQNGHKPASADLNLIRNLSVDIGLPNPCINALLSYCVQVHEGRLIPAYVEKLGAALVREGCASSRDAMDYLFRSRKKKTDALKQENNDMGNMFSENKPSTQPLKKEEKQEESLEDLLAQL